jgi:hypothetical protein
VRKRAVHTLVLAVLFILGFAFTAWPLIGLFGALLGSSDLAALTAFTVYAAGFFSIYFAYLKRNNFAPWRLEEN